MAQHVYDFCCKSYGKIVYLREHCGRVHCGRVVAVDPDYVWLEPIPCPGPGPGPGFGYGFAGGGYGAGGGFGSGGGTWFPVALAAVGGFALGSAFFW
ncbi:hypothetical protein [Texcoconibacillus texcoconensis]|uniref:Uncharacterized protein n=1 Tax=Texcoconibacillus texcoconensis TaxID=1095777 RepID=A0A840QSM0_9BACI|nr:hypothetical protein [Texcoconibacillus texcoconensis]MBB5174365.1 hypothetical protein [Texcoconibacillus texcoconensis]